MSTRHKHLDGTVISWQRQPARRRTWLLILSALIITIAYLVYTMPGMNNPGKRNLSTQSGMHDGTMPTAAAVGPAEFEQLTNSQGRILVNVHTPYDGELLGTDRFIPYTNIVQDSPQLPADRDTQLLVYCRSGRMSAVVTQILLGLGYTNVTQLSGGMDAWETSGRALLRHPGKGADPTTGTANNTSTDV